MKRPITIDADELQYLVWHCRTLELANQKYCSAFSAFGNKFSQHPSGLVQVLVELSQDLSEQQSRRVYEKYHELDQALSNGNNVRSQLQRFLGLLRDEKKD